MYRVIKPKFGTVILKEKNRTPWYAKGEYIIVDANNKIVVFNHPEVYSLKSAADKQCAYLNQRSD